MILIGTTPLPADGNILKIMDMHAMNEDIRKLVEDSRRFSMTLKKEPPKDKFLYVMQEEYCLVQGDDQLINCIGSSDSTTCLLVVLHHEPTMMTALTHIGSTEHNLAHMLQRFLDVGKIDRSDTIDLYIVGGYKDERGHSCKLISWLIRNFRKFAVKFNLKLACIEKINSSFSGKFNLPHVTGIFFNVKTGEVSPATIPCSSFGPEVVLRHARMYASFSLYEIYNSVSQCVTIDKFRLKIPRHFTLLEIWSDKDILDKFSTSPHAEPMYFVQALKDLNEYLKMNILEEKDPFGGKCSLTFRPNSSGVWTEIYFGATPNYL